MGPDGRYRVDALLAPNVVMEVDGFTYHSDPEQVARGQTPAYPAPAEGIDGARLHVARHRVRLPPGRPGVPGRPGSGRGQLPGRVRTPRWQTGRVMGDLYAGVVGQEKAVAVLTAAAARPVHAYLFVGPPGAGKGAAARSFAAALLCPANQAGEGPDGTCDSCRRVLAGVHPDVIDVEREGAAISIDTARGRSRGWHPRVPSRRPARCWCCTTSIWSKTPARRC